jgi:hypothetical protein
MPLETGAPPPARLAVAASRLASTAPGYLERVRELAGRLAARDTDQTDLQAALSAVDDLAVIDLEAPTISRIPLARWVKKSVKALVAWYLGYFGRQLTAFGQAVANLGTILAERTDHLEEETAGLGAQLASLRQRVERLEQRGGDGP